MAGFGQGMDRARSASPQGQRNQSRRKDSDFFADIFPSRGGQNNVTVLKAGRSASASRSQSARRTRPSNLYGTWPQRQSGAPNTPQSAGGSTRGSVSYDRPWLQKKTSSKGPSMPLDKQEARRQKEIASWWGHEAERMTDVISKLTTTSAQLTRELEQGKKTVRHWQYELGVAQAALDRQSEQAYAAMDMRSQLEMEVNDLRYEKEAIQDESFEKRGEVTRLSEEVQGLQDLITELKNKKKKDLQDFFPEQSQKLPMKDEEWKNGAQRLPPTMRARPQAKSEELLLIETAKTPPRRLKRANTQGPAWRCRFSVLDPMTDIIVNDEGQQDSALTTRSFSEPLRSSTQSEFEGGGNASASEIRSATTLSPTLGASTPGSIPSFIRSSDFGSAYSIGAGSSF